MAANSAIKCSPRERSRGRTLSEGITMEELLERREPTLIGHENGDTSDPLSNSSKHQEVNTRTEKCASTVQKEPKPSSSKHREEEHKGHFDISVTVDSVCEGGVPCEAEQSGTDLDYVNAAEYVTVTYNNTACGEVNTTKDVGSSFATKSPRGRPPLKPQTQPSKRGRRRKNMVPWKRGDPLHEMYSDDSQIPQQLKETLEFVQEIRKRKQEANENNSVEKKSRLTPDVVGNHGILKQEPQEADFQETQEMNASAVDVNGHMMRNTAAPGNENYLHTSQGFDDTGLCLEGDDLNFEWFAVDDDSFQFKEEQFLPAYTGSLFEHKTAYDAFRAIWDDNIINIIVRETNFYASRVQSRFFQSEWYDTNIHEVLCLFAFWMMLGIVRMPTIKACFSTDPVLKTDIFRRLFTARRYCNLVRSLHFADNDPFDYVDPYTEEHENTTEAVDHMHGIRPIIDHLNTRFKELYIPSQNVCINESLTLWKGRMHIKQFIRNKAVNFGIKAFELCESTTGYLWSFFVYTGKSLDDETFATTLQRTHIVLQLMKPLLNNGYRLFLDSWFNSPYLARVLKRNGTDCVGTLRSSRTDVPPLLHRVNLNQGQFVVRHSGDICVMAWQDIKKVVTISTCHGKALGLASVPSKTTLRSQLFKPQVVLDYNKFKGGVDLEDEMLEPYMLEQKRCTKWHMKLFKRLLSCSILNSRILVESSTGRTIDHLSFRLKLVQSILSRHLPLCPRPREAPRQVSEPNSHWPSKIALNEDNRSTRQRCVICVMKGHKNIRTRIICEGCNVALCIEPCFKEYHVRGLFRKQTGEAHVEPSQNVEYGETDVYDDVADDPFL